CTAKARVIAHALVGRFQVGDQDVLRLDVEPGMGETVYRHLDHYLISERVELSDRTKELALLRVCGSKARGLLEQLGGEPMPDLPELHHAVRRMGTPAMTVQVRRQACLTIAGYDLFCQAADAIGLREALTGAGAVVAGPQTHEVLRVEAGWPVYGVDIDEN